MLTHLHALAALCSAAPDFPALLLTMLVAGLMGGVVHCAPMCGPFVLGQVADRLARVPVHRLCEATRLRGALLLPYHGGRLLTYSGLGADAAFLGTVTGRVQWLPPMLLASAGGIFLLHALRRLFPRKPRQPIAATDRIATLIASAARPINRAHFGSGLLLGLLLGFLPCGLLYAALVAAAATQSPLAGAATMAAFGVGTVPSLILVGIAGHAARQFRRKWWPRKLAGSLILLADAVLLLVLAGRMLLTIV